MLVYVNSGQSRTPVPTGLGVFFCWIVAVLFVLIVYVCNGTSRTPSPTEFDYSIYLIVAILFCASNFGLSMGLH